MLMTDFNFVILLFLLLFVSIVVNVNTALHLLLTAELLWMTLYLTTLSAGLLFDNVNLTSLTFLFLMLSAVEFGVGLVLILIQHMFLRSISLSNNSVNAIKFSHRFSRKLTSASNKPMY